MPMKVVFNNVHSLSSLQHILVPVSSTVLLSERGGQQRADGDLCYYHTVLVGSTVVIIVGAFCFLGLVNCLPTHYLLTISVLHA